MDTNQNLSLPRPNPKAQLVQFHQWDSILSKDAYMECPKVRKRRPTGLGATAPLTVRRDGSIKDSLSIKDEIHNQSGDFYKFLDKIKGQDTTTQDKIDEKTTKTEPFLPKASSPKKKKLSKSLATVKPVGRTRKAVLKRAGSGSSLDVKGKKSKLSDNFEHKLSEFLCIERQTTPKRQYDIVMPRSATISRLLRPKYFCNDSNIVVGLSNTLKPVVLGASKEQLIELFIEVGIAENEYITEFLLTFWYFATLREVLSALARAYKCKTIPDVVEENNMVDRHKKMTRHRIYYILYTWMKHYPNDFGDKHGKRRLLKLINSFTDSEEKTCLIELYEDNIVPQNKTKQIGSPLVPFGSPRQNIIGGPASLFLSSLTVLAQQLCLIDQQTFFKVPINELRDQMWGKKDPMKNAPNITRCINLFNRISYCCATEILSHDVIKDRADCLKKIIRLAEKCLHHKGYNVTFAIVSSMNMCSISRLKKTWKTLSPKYKEKFEYLEEISSPHENYAGYKKLLLSQIPPIVPYLGVFLRDLTFLEVGNSSYLDDEETIVNYDKFRMMAMIFQELTTYQQLPFSIQPLEPIRQQFLYGLPAMDEDSLYERSIDLEPVQPQLTPRKSIINVLKRSMNSSAQI